MALTLANQARTSLLTFIHNESLCTLKSRPEIKINGRSPTEMLRSFENIEITINNPIETGFASRSGRMKSSYRYLNDIIIHSEEEEVDESFIEEDNFIMKQKTIVSEKKINKKDYSLNTTTTTNNNNNSKQKKRTKCHKSNSLSDSGEISSNKNVDYIKHSYSLLRKLSNLLKKRKVCMTNSNTNTNGNNTINNSNTSNTSNCTNNKKPNKHPHNESFTSRHNMTTPSNKDKNNLFHTINNNNNNNNNNNFFPNSNRSYGIKETDFHINLHKLTADNNNNNHNKHTHKKHNSINNTSLSETCDSSISHQPKTRKTKHKHTSNTNINSSIKQKPPLYSNRKSFVDYPTSLHAKIFAESS